MKCLYIFGFLPRLDKCCFCISLGAGSTAIGIIFIFLIAFALIGYATDEDYTHCYDKGDFHKTIGIIVGSLGLITLFATVLLLYGISKDHPTLVLIFMYTIVLLIAFNVIISILMLIHHYSEHCCEKPYLFGGANFFGAVMLLYFLIAVNSYYLESTGD